MRRLNRILKSALVAGLLGCWASFASAQSSEPVLTVTIGGAVLQPGSYHFAPGARLRSASATGLVRRDAWFLGAALLRQSAIEPQQRLKAGVLFELNANRVYAIAQNDLDRHALLDHLYTSVDAMPVTGRVRAQLDPLQQMLLPNDELLEDGDRILYPQRAEQVRVFGAVQRFCSLAFTPGAEPVDYLRQCPSHPMADPSFVFVVQPDGSWRRVGLAAWNRESAPVAVGAVLYVPLREPLLAPETTDLNEDMAAWLATQYRLGGRFSE